MADSRIIISPEAKTMIRTAWIWDGSINQSSIARLWGVSRQRINQIIYNPKYGIVDHFVSFSDLKKIAEKEVKNDR